MTPYPRVEVSRLSQHSLLEILCGMAEGELPLIADFQQPIAVCFVAEADLSKAIVVNKVSADHVLSSSQGGYGKLLVS